MRITDFVLSIFTEDSSNSTAVPPSWSRPVKRPNLTESPPLKNSSILLPAGRTVNLSSPLPPSSSQITSFPPAVSGFPEAPADLDDLMTIVAPPRMSKATSLASFPSAAGSPSYSASEAPSTKCE